MDGRGAEIMQLTSNVSDVHLLAKFDQIEGGGGGYNVERLCRYTSALLLKIHDSPCFMVHTLLLLLLPFVTLARSRRPAVIEVPHSTTSPHIDQNT